MSTTNHSSPINVPAWISPLARAGYGAKGVVYAIIGVMSLLVAFGKGGEILGSSGALKELGEKPFGAVLLSVVGIGLAAYSIYRLLCAFVDAEREGDDKSGLAKRIGYAGSGIAYAVLAVAAFSGLKGSSGGGSGGEQAAAAKVIGMPGGEWIVGAVGAGIVLAGIFQWVKAIKGSYKEKFSLDQFAAKRRDLVNHAAKAGLIARGIVFPIIGGFLIMAAVQSDPSEAKGLGEALGELAKQSYGGILLGLTAAGLLCYGFYCWILALYGNFGRR